MKSLLVALTVLAGPQQQQVVEPTTTRAVGSAIRLQAPIRVSFATKNRVVVSDSGLRQVITYRRYKDKGLAARLDTLHLGYRPLAVASWQGRTYIGNPDSGRVDIFGKQSTKVGELGGANGVFEQPNDIVIDRGRSLIYVVDPVLALVKVFDVGSSLQGTLARTIPPGGPDPSLLTEPTGLALDPGRNELLVSDFGDTNLGINPGVRFFDSSGVEVHFITGKSGSFGRRFSRPQGLAFDSDVVFVVGSWVGKVLAFDRDSGAEIGSYGSYGTARGELALPLDVAVDPTTKEVWVTDNLNGRLNVFPGGGVVQ